MDNRKIIYRNNAMERIREEHNFNMKFQSESLMNTTEESKLEVVVTHNDDYVLPPMTVPVSAFFSIQSHHKFHKNVLVSIEHFSADTSNLDFAVSRSTRPPFRCELLSGGVFYKRHGEIETREFSIFAIVLSYIRRRRRPRLYYYCAFYTSPPVDYTWTVHIYIAKDSTTNRHCIKDDAKDLEYNTHNVSIANPALDYFAFGITLSDEERSQGWYLPSDIKKPIRIKRRRIDNCRGVPTPASFKILLDISKTTTKVCQLVHRYIIADVEEENSLTMTLSAPIFYGMNE